MNKKYKSSVNFSPPNFWTPPRYTREYAQHIAERISYYHDVVLHSKIEFPLYRGTKLTCSNGYCKSNSDDIWWTPIKSESSYCSACATPNYKSSVYRQWLITSYFYFLDNKGLLEKFVK